MHGTMYYLAWILTRLMNVAAASLLFIVDRKSVKTMRANHQHVAWYQRGLFLAGWIFLIPLIGVDIPQMLLSLLLFHGTFLPTNSNFTSPSSALDYQFFIHSLSFFTWLAVFAYGLQIVLMIYVAYLVVKSQLSQRKEKIK